jgi:hypothetical protein
MSILIIETSKDVDDGRINASDLQTMQIFTRRNDGDIYMRVKAANFLLNSKTVSDSLNAGKPLIVNMRTGSTYFIEATDSVKLVKEAHLKVVK